MIHIQKADPQARRKAIFSLVGGAVVGIGLFFLLELFVGNVNDWIETNAVFLVEHHYVAFLIMLLLVSPVIWLSGYLIRFAGKIVKSERFPPPETPVIRDVSVLEGKSARVRGRLIQVVCWTILIAAAVIPVLVWFIFYSISCMG